MDNNTVRKMMGGMDVKNEVEMHKFIEAKMMKV